MFDKASNFFYIKNFNTCMNASLFIVVEVIVNCETVKIRYFTT